MYLFLAENQIYRRKQRGRSSAGALISAVQSTPQLTCCYPEPSGFDGGHLRLWDQICYSPKWRVWEGGKQTCLHYGSEWPGASGKYLVRNMPRTVVMDCHTSRLSCSWQQRFKVCLTRFPAWRTPPSRRNCFSTGSLYRVSLTQCGPKLLTFLLALF